MSGISQCELSSAFHSVTTVEELHSLLNQIAQEKKIQAIDFSKLAAVDSISDIIKEIETIKTILVNRNCGFYMFESANMLDAALNKSAIWKVALKDAQCKKTLDAMHELEKNLQAPANEFASVHSLSRLENIAMIFNKLKEKIKMTFDITHL